MTNVLVKKTLLLAFMLTMMGMANAQINDWAHAYDNVSITNVSADDNGNVYYTGGFSGTVDFDPGVGESNLTSSGNDIFVLKLSSSGSFVWVKQLEAQTSTPASNFNDLSLLAKTSGVYLLANTIRPYDLDPGTGTYITSNTSYAAYLISLDANGDLDFISEIASDGNVFTTEIAPKSNGDLVIVGSFSGTADFDPGAGTQNLTSGGFNDPMILTLTKNGAYVSVFGFSGPDSDLFSDVAIDNSDNVWVTGFQRDYFTVNGKNFNAIGSFNNFLLKIDGSGVGLVANNWGSNDGLPQITIDPITEDVYVACEFTSAADFDPGSGNTTLTPNVRDIAISKFDGAGIFQWVVQEGAANNDYVYDIQVDQQNQIHFAGSKYNSSFASADDMLYQIYDADGTLIREEIPTQGFITDIDINGFDMNWAGDFQNPANNFDLCGGSLTLPHAVNSAPEAFLANYSLEQFADEPSITATATSVFPSHPTTLSIDGGNLNDATNWQWYTGSCGGTPIGTGTSIMVSPSEVTTYYVRGEGYSCNDDNRACASITITIDDPYLTYGTYFDLTDGGTYSGNSFDFSNESTTIRSITYNNDGSKMYLMAGDRNIYQYSLSAPFDLGSSITYDGSPYATGMNEPRELEFSPDGTKMFIVDNKLTQVTQFSLTTPFDVTSGVTSDGSRSVSGQIASNSPWGIGFNADGTKMLVSGIVEGLIYQYSLASPYDVISNVTYDNITFDPVSVPTYLTFNPDGTIFYVANYQYDLATPFDISTGVTSVGSIVLENNQNSGIHGVHFSNDGAKLYLGSDVDDSVHEYLVNTGGYVEIEDNDGSVDGSLAVRIIGDTFTNAGGALTETTDYTVDNLPAGLTPILTVAADGMSATLTLSGNASLHQDIDDLSSLSFTFENSAFTNSNASSVIDAISASSEIGIDFTQNVPVLAYDYAYNPANFQGAGNFGVLAQEGSTHGITFNDDGSKVYIVGTSNAQVFQYSLSTAFNVTTATLDGSSISLGTQDGNPLGLAFNNDGTSLFVAGGVSESILEYSLTTPYDVTSGFSYSNNSLDVSAQGYPNGIAFSEDGMTLFTTSASTGQVSQFSLTTAYDISSGVNFDGAYSVLEQENTPNGIAFSESGTKMIIMGSSTQASQKYVHNYHLDIPFDITGSVTPYNNPVNVAAYEFGPTDIAFSNDGDRMFIVGYNGDEINQLNMQKGSMVENASNDGSIDGSYTLQIYDELFTNTGGTLTQGVDYNISNLPAGLTTSIAVSGDGKTGTLTVSGNATNHDVADNVENLIFTFENSAFSIGDASFVTHAVNASSELSIHFIEAPSIENQTFSIAENSANTTVVGTVIASDGDGDPITYTITAGNDIGGFTIDANSGEISVADQTVMDFETNPSFDLTVEVSDGSLTNSATVTIDLTNVAEAPTDISLSQNSIDENNAINDVIGQLSTTDEDTGETYAYTFVSGSGDTDNGSFNIDGDQLRASISFDFESKDTYSVRVQTDDGNGGLFEKAFTISINDISEAPTDINLFGSSINENNAIDAEIGTFFTTDDDNGETHTYTLVSGTGDTDNASFNILNNKLRASESFNFESKNSYSIRIQTDDGNSGTFEKQFSISINDISEAPTDITLSASAITENNSINDVIGSLSSIDDDNGETHSYSLVSGTGDTDNASFNIDGDQLRASETFDFETQDSYSIRVQTNDGNFGLFEKVFIITVNNQSEAPSDILLSSNDINESSPAGTTVGNLSTVDEDNGETYTYAFVSGTGDTDNASFTISASELKSAEIFDYETKTSYSVRIQTNDGNGGVIEKAFTISINDQPPGLTGVGLTSDNIDESAAVGNTVGNLFALGDEIEGVSFTFSLVSGAGDTGNGSFSIVGEQLRSAISFDHESQDQYSIRVMADDGQGSTIEQILLIDINDINEAPTFVDLDENEFDETETLQALTSFLVQDEDEGDGFSIELISGAGDSDNGKFTIVAGQGSLVGIENNEPLDFETQNSYSIRVRVTDTGGLTLESALQIFVNDINEAPVFSNQSFDLPENATNGTVVGTLSAFDEDSDPLTFSNLTGTSSFSLNSNGELTLTNAASLNHEDDPVLILGATVSDDGTPALTDMATIQINVTDVNEDPTDITLSNNTVEESNPIGTYVGSLSSIDEDAGQVHTYSFVAGSGDDNNASFTISGADILSGEIFDFETKNSYSVRVRSEDGNGGSFEKSFTISIDDLPASITSFELSNTSINENEILGSAVGSFSATGEDLSGSFTYSLVSGLGSDDNTSFSISGNQLLTGSSFNFEVKNSFSVRVMVDDGAGNTDEKVFSIGVNDVSEAPTDLILSANSIAENNLINAVIGTLSSTDEDTGESFTYSLVNGTGDIDNASFSIAGNELRAAEVFDFETQNSYAVRIETNDGNGGVFSKSFTLSITNQNEGILVANPINDQELDEGFISLEIDLTDVFTDQDGDPLTYEVASSDETVVTVSNSGAVLTITEAGNFGSSTITVTADDGSGVTTIDEFVVTVSNVNDAPVVSNALTDQNEDEGFGSLEFDLTSTFSDEDGDDLMLSASSSDETVATVSISGTTLTITEIGNGTTIVSITANDGNGGTVTDEFTLTVNNVNDAPMVANALTDQNLDEGFTSIEVDLSNTFSDEDGDNLTLSASSSNEAVVSVSLSGSTMTISEVGNGTAVITVTANDGNGGSVADEFTVTVINVNDAPVVANPIADQNLDEGFGSMELDLFDTFSDPDGDALILSVVSSNESVAAASLSGTTLTISEVSNGSTTVTITANDGNGGSVADEFIVTVSEAPNNAPVVVNPLDDQTSLVEGFANAQISYANVFEDPDGDALTITVASSNESVVTVAVIANDQIQINEVGIGTSTITLTANDGNGGSVSDEFIVTVSESPNNAPVVVNPINDQTSLVEGFANAQISYVNVFEDPDGDALTITVASSNESVVTVAVIANDQIQINEVGIGTSTITLTANDGNGGSVFDEFVVTVSESPNNAPIVVNPIDDQPSVVEGFASAQISFAGVFDDADGDVLTITVRSSDESVVTVELIGNEMIQISEVGLGTSTITLTANDGNGGEVSDQFTFTVEKGLGFENPIDVKIYPNPVSDFLQIKAVSDINVMLYDLNGRVLQSDNGTSIRLDVRAVGSGVYLLKVDDGHDSNTQRIKVTH